MRRRRGYALSAALLLAAALGHPSQATAAPNDEDAAPNDEDVAAMKPPAAAAATPKQWPASVPQFRWWEYAGTAALLGGSLALRFTVDVSGEPTWRGGILHDELTYQTLLVESPPLFRTWRTIGDVGYVASFAWSLMDPVIAGLTHGADTGAQMALMNLEAFAVYSMVVSVSQIIVRRERPTTRLCDDPLAGQLGVSCPAGGRNRNVNRSFIGGHAGTVATAATLTCIHHAKLGLWGSPQADALPCVTWTAMTALVAASRTRTGQHYFSDNLLGITVGGLSALVPYGLHYALAIDAPTAKAFPLVQPTSLMATPRTGGMVLQLGGVM